MEMNLNASEITKRVKRQKSTILYYRLRANYIN